MSILYKSYFVKVLQFLKNALIIHAPDIFFVMFLFKSGRPMPRKYFSCTFYFDLEKRFIRMATATKGTISLQGSAQMISEFLDFGINSILFQRGIYPGIIFSRKMRTRVEVQLLDNY